MATISTFTGDGGPILSLTGEQHMEFVLFCGITPVAAFLALLIVICQSQMLEDIDELLNIFQAKFAISFAIP